MTKKTIFEKKEKWVLHTFYQLYMQDNIKMIRLIGSTDRQPRSKNYLSWICIFYGSDCCMPLDEFLSWDVYYQMDNLIQNGTVREVEVEPEECFDQSNIWIKGDGTGSVLKNFLDLTENTACDYYYGY